MAFTDTEFMTTHDKELTLKSWERFLRNGLQRKDFTKRVYEHLHLHCGFIAHYDINGFYATYFQAGQDTERFFKHFIEYTYNSSDISVAMKEVYNKYKNSINKQAEDNITDRLDLLEECIKRAKQDRELAREFLSKIGF